METGSFLGLWGTKMNYRDTVNLPQTDFPQRANLAQREPDRLAQWQAQDLYFKCLARREGAPTFDLHDGPPYSNGHIHVGTALNKILKDIVVRYHDLAGYRSAYQPGWDNHGLPIEFAVSEKFRQQGKEPDILTLRKACRAHAANWIDTQREEFMRLGGIGDWFNPYLTMSHEFEAGILEAFAKLAKQGYVYRGMRSVWWAPGLGTALADAELEYQQHTSTSIFVPFKVTEPGAALAGHDDAYVVIWTTTPWTIPSNMGIALHPEIDYRLLKVGGKVYVVADYLAGSLAEKFGWDAEKLEVLPGSAFEGVVTKHPLYDRPSPIVFADYVTVQDGTGCVHTAPGHGKEDFETGAKYGLEPFCPVDEKGVYTAEVGPRLAGKLVLQTNGDVCDWLTEVGALLAVEDYVHDYPHDWRAHEPVIVRATTQWFLSIDHERAGKTHRQRAVEAIGETKWYPAEGRERITPMVQHRPDWCLSRQRAWGVGIPAFYCGECGAVILDETSLDAAVELVRREGSDAWFEQAPSAILPQGYVCPECGASPEKFTKEEDVLDVWFDSGSTHQVCYPADRRPVDVYLEGSDQHRGWFNSSLMVSVGIDDRAPYQAVVTHGFVLDERGYAMSKSIGNVIAPRTLIDKYGADVLRLWVASADFFQDVRIGNEILERVADTYRHIRNSFRFMLGNLFDFDPATEQVELAALGQVDRYVLHRFEQLKEVARKAYDEYQFHRLVQAVHQFVLEVSATYLDIAKDELYCGAATGAPRRAIQTVLYQVLGELARLLAPILPFTCDEVWSLLPGEHAENVQLEDYPTPCPERLAPELAARFARLTELRDVVKLAQEHHAAEAQAGGSKIKPLEMAVKLTLSPADAELVGALGDEFRTWLVVSHVTVEVGAEQTVPTATVTAAAGHRCERCWRVYDAAEFGHVEGHGTVCDRCGAAAEQGTRS